MEEIIGILCKGIKSGESYPPSMRAFCLSMHYLSPRAYRFLRGKFGNNMPHPETLRQWYRNSDLDASSGISARAIQALKEKAAEVREKGVNEQ